MVEVVSLLWAGLVVLAVTGALVVLYYTRPLSGEHGGAGDGALTVAQLCAQPARPTQDPDTGLCGLDMLSGYTVAEVLGRHHKPEDITSIPVASTLWGGIDPTEVEHTTELTRVLVGVA